MQEICLLHEKCHREWLVSVIPPLSVLHLRQSQTKDSKTEILVLLISKGHTLKNLRYGDLYRNIQHYLKYNECSHYYTGTRKWLQKYIHDPNRIDAVISKIKSSGTNCDCEILTKIKPKLNGRSYGFTRIETLYL